MNMEATLKTFFTSSKFAVVGASSDPSKFGHKGTYTTPNSHSSLTTTVFVWYLTHGLPVTPINPRASSITVSSKEFSTVSSPTALEHASDTSLSIITPPSVTLSVLKEAKEAGIPAVWLQPGTYNDEVIAYAKKEFKAAIAGYEGEDVQTVGDEGWCVLVDGEDGLKIAGRAWKREKL